MTTQIDPVTSDLLTPAATEERLTAGLHSERPDSGRRCTVCGRTRPPAEFYKDGRARDGLSHRCKACANAHVDRWRKAHAPRVNELNRKRNERITAEQKHAKKIRAHGMTVHSYNEMLAAQGGVCALCHRGDPGTDRRLNIDHDHACCPGDTSCGKCVRGLLCGPCNRALGMFDDNPATLRAAIAYLNGH